MTFTRRLLVAGAALTSACASSPQAGSDPAAAPPSAEALTAELQRVFDRSARDWNAGDLDGFMADYANESTTSYVSRGAVRYGYDTIRGVYAGRFAPGAQRDSLSAYAAAEGEKRPIPRKPVEADESVATETAE